MNLKQSDSKKERLTGLGPAVKLMITSKLESCTIPENVCICPTHICRYKILFNILFHKLLVELRSQRIVDERLGFVGLRAGTVLENDIIVPASFNLEVAP